MSTLGLEETSFHLGDREKSVQQAEVPRDCEHRTAVVFPEPSVGAPRVLVQ